MLDSVRSLICNGREERHLEFKRSMNWSSPATKSKIVKSALAMANLRDGGTIILGVDRNPDDSYAAIGMTQEDQDSFRQDDVSVEVNNYADPFIEVAISKQELDNKRFVVITVSEFSELPIVCKRDGADRIRKGAICIRPRQKFETAEIPSQVEMRELLDLATEKKIRAFQAQLQRLGTQLAPPNDYDSQAFNDQLGGL